MVRLDVARVCPLPSNGRLRRRSVSERDFGVVPSNSFQRIFNLYSASCDGDFLGAVVRSHLNSCIWIAFSELLFGKANCNQCSDTRRALAPRRLARAVRLQETRNPQRWQRHFHPHWELRHHSDGFPDDATVWPAPLGKRRGVLTKWHGSLGMSSERRHHSNISNFLGKWSRSTISSNFWSTQSTRHASLIMPLHIALLP